MALFPLNTAQSPASIINETDVVYTGTLAQNVLAGQPCFINSQGLIVLCSSGLPTTVVDGWTTRTALVGETMTLVRECTFNYPQVAGATTTTLYVGNVPAGSLDDVPSGSSTVPVAYMIHDRQINESSKNISRIRGVSTY